MTDNQDDRVFPLISAESLLICNGCGIKLNDGEIMVCASCDAKLPKFLTSFTIDEPRDTSHVIPGTCPCPCHDDHGIMHFAPCCSQTYEPRNQLISRNKSPLKASIGDFTKFVFPLIRPSKVELIDQNLKQVSPGEI